jgi:hypothetical protein
MNAGKFWLLTFLAVVIALLIFIEIACENQVWHLENALNRGEAQVAVARQQNEMLRQLVQKMAMASEQDPAIADVLAKYGIHVTKPETPAVLNGATPSSTP